MAGVAGPMGPGFEGERTSYDLGGLDESAASDHPIDQLRRWLDEAVAQAVSEPTAMTLSTLGPDQRVRSRTVLLRRLGPEGLAFFTNLDSDKAVDLLAHPLCSAQFLWLDQHRQVRVEGRARLVAPEEADAYFAGRPRGSQIGAWASPQSQVVDDRSALDHLVDQATRRFDGVDPIPRPPFWGGFRIVPDLVEFWQGRPSRLHDRLRYRLVSEVWVRERLAP